MAFDHGFRSSGVTRRHVVGGAAALTASLALTRHGLAQNGTPTASGTPVASGEWSFTDDKGVTVTLPSRPERLVIDVNAAAPLWDFGIRPVAVFGWNATESGDFGDAGGNIDADTVEIVGNTAEPIQPEAVVAVDPDLIITMTFSPDDPEEYWSIDPALLPQVEPIAPVIAMSGTGSARENTERFAELAEALGADLSTPELADSQERYETAITDFSTLASETSDLSVLFIYVDAETVYVANPSYWADLAFYQELGLNIVVPDNPDTYWEQLSLEQALKYPSDIFMQSTRPGTLTREELVDHPTFGAHPAVQAGQIGAWNQDFILSYQGMADALEAMMPVISEATDVTD